jgi:hypothetical protein
MKIYLHLKTHTRTRMSVDPIVQPVSPVRLLVEEDW